LHIYLVGGAVRDQLLGLSVEERDWVVVGSTPEEMLALGFIPVGKEFPVFLHPETYEEYALARSERKIAKGYKGFTFYADKAITLEQDLQRRDLTINAIAMDEHENIIDPFNGKDDLIHKIFRHVSAAFQEDPVRILRIARLATKFTEFAIHPETLQLMQNMVKMGEVDALVAERIWQEFQRALANVAPVRFFNVLHQCGALNKLFPKIDINGNGIKKLEQSSIKSPAIKFALLLYDTEVSEIKKLTERYRIPNQFSDLAILISKYGAEFANLNLNSASDILQLLLYTDAFRRSERFFEFLTAANMCYGPHTKKIILLRDALDISKNIDSSSLQQQGIQGKAFAEQLNTLRTIAIAELINQLNSTL